MKVIEIFRSLQGEGRHQGSVTTFIRLSGCNLNCKWCDTPESHEGGIDMDIPEIVRAVENLGSKDICVTGGEPLLWMEELVSLLRELSKKGYHIEIETNGTIDPTPCMEYAEICMDMKCPSSEEESDSSLIPLLRPTDSVKFVTGGSGDLKYAKKVIESSGCSAEIFISPVWGADMGEIADYIIDNMMPVRFQVQLHKIIGVK
ncbi:radical SAM protein [Methanoplanus sp. FWC-SCC4]|uniref:7-carboxy-7-deazaguanine synthase n=1 Tax=Methanochimaera problematica TaxID=2609417 RepID=A0AA97I4R8_9EURY|nr:radical SAM protein [Methanoplanus sp. FWC-SCC4]WOF16651.1 radical SAM protein [Methanoplanus sp. FWC-SCC4]